jgi:hypothetical protein
LANPLVKEFFDKCREDIVDSMETSALGDDKTHNRLVIALQVLAQIENAFKTVISTGKMARIQVNEPTILGKVAKFGRR